MVTGTLEELALELRRAFKGIVRRPVYLALSAGSVAVGIGVAGLMLAAREVLLPPASTLKAAASVYPILRGNVIVSPTMSISDFRTLEAHSSPIIQSAAGAPFVAAVVTSHRAGIEQIEAVSGKYFETLELRHTLGRLLVMKDDEDKLPVVVLSEPFWRQWLRASTDAVGQEITIAGQPFVVVGIANRGFDGVRGFVRTAAWIPLSTAEGLPVSMTQFGAGPQLDVVVRPAVRGGIAQARGELASLSQRLDALAPMSHGGHRQWSLAGTIEDYATAQSSGPAASVAGLAGCLILVVACVTMANLSIARSAERSREMFVRRFLGAQRSRLVLHLMCEAFVVVGIGSVLGFLLLTACLNAAYVVVPLDDFANMEISFGSRISATAVAGFGAIVALVVAGLWPALRSARATGRQHANAGSAVSLRLVGVHGKLIAWQTAATVSLSLLAFVCIRTVDGRSSANSWEGVERSAVALVPFAGNGMRADESLIAIESVTETLTVSGQASAALSVLPTAAAPRTNIRVPPNGTPLRGSAIGASSDALAVIGLQLIAGEWFRGSLFTAGRETVVSRRLAERLFRSVSDSLGQTIEILGNQYTIVGICESSSRSYGPDLAAYVPLRHVYGGKAALVVKAVNSDVAARALRRELHSVAPNVVPTVIGSGAAVVGRPYYLAKLIAFTVTLLSSVALLLALIGLQGVLMYSVTSRTTEVGIRLACGATAVDVARAFIAEGLAPVGKGVLVGSAVAWAVPVVARATTAVQLDEVGMGRALAVSLFVCFAAALASAVPAFKATRVDPSSLLRQE